MAANASVDSLEACLLFLDWDLEPQEAIVRIEQGQTSYAKNTTLFYRAQIGTFETLSGNTLTNTRFRVIQVTPNTPHEVGFADDSDWKSLEPGPTS